MKKLLIILLIEIVLSGCSNTPTNNNAKGNVIKKPKINSDIIKGNWILINKENDHEIFEDSTVFTFEKFTDDMGNITFYTIGGKLKHFTSMFINANDRIKFDIYLDFGDNRTLSIIQVDTNKLTIKNSNNLFYFKRLQGSALIKFKANLKNVREVENRILPYNIVECKDIGIGNTFRKVCRVLLKVNKLPTENEMNKVFTKIWKQEGNGYDEFTIFFYLPEMDINDMAYCASEYKNNGSFTMKTNTTSLYGTKWVKE